MASLSPLLTATPTTPPTYNVGMAETFSWVPVEGAGRPLFARATYLANPEDIKVSLSAGNLNISLDELELNTDEVEGLIRTANETLTAFKLENDVNIKRTNTLLNYLTATQDDSVSLLHALTANTDDLEELVIENNTLLNSLTAITQSEFNENNTLLNSLTAITQSEFNETQTLLSSLTALQEDKQSQIITLLHQLTANTDELEVNTDGVETLLSSLTALAQSEFNETQTLLDALTAQQNSSQTTIITLLNQLTANTDTVESLISDSNARLDALTAVDYATEAKQDSAITLLHQLTANTDSIESLLQTSNSLLDSISAKEMTISLDVSAINLNTDEIEGLIKTSNTLLDALTAKVTVADVSGIETRLDVLTAVDYATEAKQDVSNTLLDQLTSIQNSTQSEIITLLHSITGSAIQVDLNTDQLELHVDDVETKLDAITAIDFATSTKQDSIITLLDALTAKQTTINLDVSAINLNTDEIEGLIETSNTLLDALTAKDYTTSVTGIETRLDVLTAVDYATEAKQDVSNTLLSDLTASNKYVPGFSIPPYDEIGFEYVGTTDIFRKVTYLNNSTQVMALSFVYVTEPPTVGDAIIQSVKKI